MDISHGDLKPSVHRAAKPQSTMPCNHVTSCLERFAVLTTEKRECGKESGKQYSNRILCNRPVCNPVSALGC